MMNNNSTKAENMNIEVISTAANNGIKNRNGAESKQQHRRSASERFPTTLRTKTPAEVACHRKQKSSTWESPSNYQLDVGEQITDPITSIVEKRLSLTNTAKRQLRRSTSSDDVFDERRKNPITNVWHTASGFLSGTMRRIRQQAVNLKRSALSSKKSSEIASTEHGREDAASVISSAANCISDTLTLRAVAQGMGSATSNLQLAQEMNNEHTGPVWCIKFSDCGRLLATGGQDRNVRIWVLRSALNYFTSIREQSGCSNEMASNPTTFHDISKMHSKLQQYANLSRDAQSKAENDDDVLSSPSNKPSMSPRESFSSSSSSHRESANGSGTQVLISDTSVGVNATQLPEELEIFSSKPFCIFRGHTADVLDLSWSPRNFFLLSGSTDRTVRLWHLSRVECLCSFQHVDFVTCIAFMPKDDRYFISGSLDGKIRLWSIPEKRVAIWNEVEDVFNKFITAIAFAKGGKFVVVGTYSGRCFFYSTDQLKYHTVIDARSTKGKNSKNPRCKITSLAVYGDKLLVSSNDSRVRIYDLRDMELCCKFRGAQVEDCLVRAAFSPDGKHIICGSEDHFIYLWRNGGQPTSLTVRNAWERVRAHHTAVTTACFAPKPQLILDDWLAEQQQKAAALSQQQGAELIGSAAASTSHGYSSMMSIATVPSKHSSAVDSTAKSPGDVIVSADLSGSLKMFVNPTRLLDSNRLSRFPAFH